MTTTAKKMADLAAQGKNVRQIAEALGISRQRVYQIKERYGIRVAKERLIAPDRAPRSPKERVLTGGVAVQINQSTVGTIAELLVAADLMTRGWTVYFPFVRSRGHDLVAARKDALFTVEVRSAYRKKNGDVSYTRRTDDCSSHYALVVTGEPVTYHPDLPECPKLSWK